MKCDFDPTVYKDAPLGMFHCPLCGEMVVAGLPHPDYEYVDTYPKQTEDKDLESVRVYIWNAKNANIEVYSDGEQFVCLITDGMSDTLLSVGYSCQNYAEVDKFTRKQIDQIAKKLDEYWDAEDRRYELDDMLPVMYKLAKIANEEFNKVFWSK